MWYLALSDLVEGRAKEDVVPHVRVLDRRFDASIVIEYEELRWCRMP